MADIDQELTVNDQIRIQQRDLISNKIAEADSPTYISSGDVNKTRTATIADPRAVGNGPKNELDSKGAVSGGNCAIKYENTSGGAGIIRDHAGEIKWKKAESGRSINPEERTNSEYNTNDNLQIQTPNMMWTGGENWCGLNWKPPTGTRVTVTQGPNGIPQIAGTAPADASKCKPVLNVGEVCLKGYGNAYVMCRQSDKVDIVAGASAGNYDLDDPNGGKTNASDCSQMIRLDANGGNLLIRCTGGGGSSAISMTGTEITITSKIIRLQADMIYEN